MSERIRTLTLRASAIALCCALGLGLAGCNDEKFDTQSQIGPNPQLPEPQQYLFPPMHLADVVGWQEGEAPKVAQGLSIKAMASDLAHPRSIYVLPNGDILVIESQGPGVEPVTRPKSVVMGFVESLVTELGIVLIVRTEKPFWKSRASRPLVWLSIATGLLAVAIPYLPGAGWFGFVPLPPLVLAGLVAITVAYLAASEAAKRSFFAQERKRRAASRRRPPGRTGRAV